MTSRIRILVIASNRLHGENATAALNNQPGFKAVFACGVGDEILAGNERFKPTILLFDAGPSDEANERAVRKLLTAFPSAKLILMNLESTQPNTRGYLEAGVSGFILKEATFEDCLSTIRLVSQGKKILPPNLMDALFTQAVRSPISRKHLSGLSDRQQQVVGHIVAGRNNEQIALEMELSVHTVKSHIHNILEKLRLRSRLELAAYAVAHGFASKPSTVNFSKPRTNRKD